MTDKLTFIKGDLLTPEYSVYPLLANKTEYYNWIYPISFSEEHSNTWNAPSESYKVVQSFEIEVHDNLFTIRCI